MRVEYSTDYLKKERINSEIFNRLDKVQHKEQVAKSLEQGPGFRRLKRSDDTPALLEGFRIGEAIGDGDCFFDSIAQGLKRLKPEMDLTVKSLREVCKDLAVGNQQLKSKIVEDARNSQDPTIASPKDGVNDDMLWTAYLASIEYTSDDINKMRVGNPSLYQSLADSGYGSTLQVPIWGRPDIEGQMICEKYNVKLCVIEKHIVEEEVVWSNQIIGKTGSESNDVSTIYIINMGNAHFKPMLRTQEIQHNKQRYPEPSDYDEKINVQILESHIQQVSVEEQPAKQERPSEENKLEDSNQKNKRSEQGRSILIDVPGDNSCLFWSVALAYLVPVKDDDFLLQKRCKTLFGEESVSQYLGDIKALIQDYNPLLDSNPIFYNQVLISLVTNTFRNKVIDHISSHGSKFRDFVEGDFESYLENMRKPDAWGGEPKIKAMSEMLDATISVLGVSKSKYENGDIQIELFHVELSGTGRTRNHYNFRLEQGIIDYYREKRSKKGRDKPGSGPEESIIQQRPPYDNSQPRSDQERKRQPELSHQVSSPLEQPGGNTANNEPRQGPSSRIGEQPAKQERPSEENKLEDSNQKNQKLEQKKLAPLSDKLPFDKDLKLSNGNFKSIIEYDIKDVGLDIADKLSFLNRPAYPDEYLLVHFASRVYKERKDGQELPDRKLPEGWKLLTTAYNQGNTNHYFGAAYWNPDQQQIVIAHRGTDPSSTGALWTDIRGILQNNYVPQMNSAVTFANEIKTVLDELNKKPNVNLKLSFTGHSLGGWLAQITTFTTKYLILKSFDGRSLFVKSEKVGYHAHTVAFDSPGSKDMLSKIKNDFDVRHNKDHDSLSPSSLDITSYLSAPNLVNTCCSHLGSIYRVLVDNLSPERSGWDFGKYTIETHSIVKIEEALDPERGNELKAVIDWPLVKKGITRRAIEKLLLSHQILEALRAIVSGQGKSETSPKPNEYEYFHRLADGAIGYNPKPDNKGGYCTVRYQVQDINKAKCSTRIFTQPELEFLRGYQGLRLFCQPFQLQDVFSSFENENAVKEATEILKNFEVEDQKKTVRCKSETELNKMITYVKNALYFFPDVKDRTKNLQIRKQIWFDIKEPVKSFTGRDGKFENNELQDLHNALQNALQSEIGQVTISQTAAVVGLGGVGKSELARKYAHDHQRDYGGNVIWLNSETQGSLRESFQRLAKEMKISITEKIREQEQEQERDIKSIVVDVYKDFSNVKSLFIFDNAEKFRTQEEGDAGIDKFLPSLPPNANKPYVLITSRNQKWGNIQVIPLGTFTEKEAMDFIGGALGIKDQSQENEIKNLAKTLQNFPLALQQAVAYIKERDVALKNAGSKFDINDYLKRYDKEAKELLGFKFPDDSDNLYTKTTLTTWKITTDKIKKDNKYGKQAGEILDIISYFAPDSIPVEMFSGLELIKGDKEKLGFAVQLLKQYSIVNSGQEQAVLNIHRLVQQVTRVYLKDLSREEETLKKALELINNGDMAKESRSHVTSVWSYASKYGKLIDDFYGCHYNGRFGDKVTPLHLLAEEGDDEAINKILEHMKGTGKLDEVVNPSGRQTPLHVAIRNDKLNVIKLLLQNGANVNAIDEVVGPRGANTLELAASYGSEGTVVSILGKINIDEVKGKSLAIMYNAVCDNTLDVIKLLMDKIGKNFSGKEEIHGTGLLHYAARRGELDIIEYLEDSKFINSGVDSSGQIPLHYAAEGGNLKVVKHFVEEKGAKINANAIGIGFLRGTPLHYAAYGSNFDVVKYLVEKGAKIDTQSKLSKVTPLHYAAEGGNVELVRYLVEKGAEINAEDKYGKTPLHSAAEGGSLEVVKYFVEEKKYNIEANAKGGKHNYDAGGTPLHYAASKGRANVVKYLIYKGAKTDAKDGKKKTPLALAKLWYDKYKGFHPRLRKDYEETIKVLEQPQKVDYTHQVPGNPTQPRQSQPRQCLPGSSSGNRRKREAKVSECLFTWEDVDEFNVEKDENRDFSKINIDSQKFINYVKDLPEEKRSQLIQLANEVQVTGGLHGLVNKLTSNQKVMNHLSKMGKISGITMHSMMAKNVLADFLNGNYQGVAVNVGFIAGGQGFAKVAEAASLKGLELASKGKFLLSRSLKAASPFLARGTSAFVVYDLINQVKEYKNGTEEALVGIVGDGIYLGVDAAEIGIEVAEAFELLEGVSSVTGPIGATIGAVVFVGTDIYMAVKRVDKIDEIIHLTGNEKFVEGLRAFIGMEPRQYIEELMEEKQVNNQLVNQGLEYLQQHSDIKRYIFPTGKSVVDSCSLIPYDATKCIRTLGLNGGRCLERQTVTKYYRKCTNKFEVDLNNEVLLDSKRTDIKWSRARPDNPNGGELFCLPQGDYEHAPSYGSYFCESAIGVTDLNRNKIGNYTLINLGEGNDYAKGFVNSGNIFVVNDGLKRYYGGNKDDIFILQGSAIKGYLFGEGGINTLDLTGFSLNSKNIDVVLNRGDIIYNNYHIFQAFGIDKVIGRKAKAERIFSKCDTQFVDGKGGSERFKDQIEIYDENCGYEMQIVVRPNTVIHNRALEGNFHYTVPYGLGSAKIDFIYSSEDLNVNNTFTFEYEPIEIKNINVRNINVLNKTSHVITFNFAPMSNKEFNITISGASNPSYRLGSGSEIKVGNKGNLYMLENTNQSVDKIIKAYLPVANRLSKMSFFIQSLANNETVVIGSGNYEVIHNNPLHKSHLVGNGGENVYVIDSRDKKLEVPEVVIYDLDVESSVDTIDLRNLVQQARGKLSNKESFELKIIKLANDLLLKGEITELKKTEDSFVSEMKKHECFTVRLKDGVNLYNKTHVILNNVPMGINFDNNEWSLKPLPLVFERDKEIIIVTSQDIEANTKLITPKRAGNYKFVRDNGNDLVITNAFDANVGKNDLCAIVLSKFYETPKMATLSIKFADKEINLKDYQEQINTARDINVVKKEYKDQVYNDVFNYTGSKVSPEMMLSDQPMGHKHRHKHSRQQTRHRRHHHNKQDLSHAVGELSNQAVSSSTRLSSRINDLFGWIKSSIGGLFNSRAILVEERPKTTSSISQVDARADVNSTIMLLDLLMRKVTGQKYISTVEQQVPLLEARSYALNITERFEKVVEQAAEGSTISMHRLNVDFMEMEKEITRKIIGGKFDEISGVLSSYVEKACPGREAGKLSSKKFDKFMTEFNNKLDIALNQSIPQMVSSGHNTLEINSIKEQNLENKKPKSYLDNISAQGHLTHKYLE